MPQNDAIAADSTMQADWADTPPCASAWRDLARDEAAALLRRLDAHAAAHGEALLSARFAVERMRLAPLQFYPGCVLIDLQGRIIEPADEAAAPRRALASLVYGPRGPLYLDGKSAAIHALNLALPVALDADNAAAYLRFFCSFVHGAAGPFRVVERLSDLRVAPEADEAARAAIADALTPLAAAPSDPESNSETGEGPWRFRACVQYGPDLSAADFRVLRNGHIEMEDDDPLLADQPLLPYEYRGLFRFPPRPDPETRG